MPLGLTGSEWGILVVSIGPVVIAALVVWFFWRWSKRSDAEEAEQSRDDQER